MGIKIEFDGLDEFLEQIVSKIEAQVLVAFMQVGEQLVADARSLNTYKDQTNNLRSSIGYEILKDGRSIKTNFQESGSGVNGSGSQGMEEGKKYIRSVFTDDVNTGYSLVAVAGMDYAREVEAKGYDVLSGPILTASSNLKERLNRIF